MRFRGQESRGRLPIKDLAAACSVAKGSSAGLLLAGVALPAFVPGLSSPHSFGTMAGLVKVRKDGQGEGNGLHLSVLLPSVQKRKIGERPRIPDLWSWGPDGRDGTEDDIRNVERKSIE